ncbi:unnamed protein product [Scytosiphon promiscuus]
MMVQEDEADVGFREDDDQHKPGSPRPVAASSTSTLQPPAASGGSGRPRCRLLLFVAAGVLVVITAAGFFLNGIRKGDEREDLPLMSVGGEGEKLLPRCYSSPEADPSQGKWRKCDGGVEDSPANTGNFTGPWKTTRTEIRCSQAWAEENREGTMPYWSWEASECRLESVDAAKFCDVVEGRKGILFVGDSLTGQMIDTLAAILRATVVDHVLLTSDSFSACDGTFEFSWYRNDFLDTRTDGFDTVHCEDPDISMSHCKVFADDSTLSQFDTLIVNAGAHIRSGGLPAYGEMMKNASERLTESMKRLHGENSILVVRNTVPGHSSSYERMFDGPVDLETALALVGEGPPVYRWTGISDKNKLLEEAFTAADGWTLLDAYGPTVLRADSHAGDDGLHYCVPGPIDHWVKLLYNILLEKASSPGKAGDDPEPSEP